MTFNRLILAALTAFIGTASTHAGHTPTIAFNTDPNALRDQVLKASGDRYALPFGGHGNASAPNQPIRDLATGATFAIPTQKPNHQFQVSTLVGATGAAGGWVGFDGSVPQGFVWTPTQGTTYIPPLAGNARSSVVGVSADGNAAYGRSFSGGDSHDFYWTRGGQPIDLVQSALGGANNEAFQPTRMRPDGVVEGTAIKYGLGGGSFDATWSPSQGLQWGKKQVDGPAVRVQTPAGAVATYFNSGKGEGTVSFIDPKGALTPLWHYEFDQNVDPVALTAGGKFAFVNAEVDGFLAGTKARVLALDTSVASNRPAYMEKDPQLADYLIQQGLDPAALQGNTLYEILALTPDGTLLFGSAGKGEGLGTQYTPDTYFLINLGPTGSGGPATPEPAGWLVFAVVSGFALMRSKLSST